MRTLRNRIRLVVVLILGLAPQVALACKGDTDHNRKFHGDAQCRNCSCVHHHPEPKDLIFVSLEEEDSTFQSKSIDPNKSKAYENSRHAITVEQK